MLTKLLVSSTEVNQAWGWIVLCVPEFLTIDDIVVCMCIAYYNSMKAILFQNCNNYC